MAFMLSFSQALLMSFHKKKMRCSGWSVQRSPEFV